jgi:Tfp pilus assembly protein PilO
MRSNERMIFVGVALVALAVGFYLLVLAPKRADAGKLKDQINELHASISAAEQQATYGEEARQDFPKYYGRMVVLGKAVPGEADTASMLVQFSSISRASRVKFNSIELSQGNSGASEGSGGGSGTASGSSSPTSPTGAAEAAASTASTANSATPTSSTSSGTSATSAPATEASAATLPIGATVGSAGLPTLPYDLKLQGSYFNVANFIGKVDGLVQPVDDGARLAPDGRLITLGGFSFKLLRSTPTPLLSADFVINAYSTGDQGLTLGASPSGPAPTSPGATDVQPASAVVAK